MHPLAPTTRATLPGFEHRDIDANGIRLHCVVGGRGDPLLLWHGFCETWWCWRKVLPALAQHFTVIAPDMRGFGDSDKPAQGYDGLTLAEDVRALLLALDVGPAFVAAHDMGAPPALLLAAAHPDEVRALAYLEEPVMTMDVMRQIHDFTSHATRNGLLWWWKFAFAPELPELLLEGKEREFLSWFYRRSTFDATSVEEGAVQEYLRTFATPEGVRGAFGVYRDVFETIRQTERLTDPACRVRVPLLGLGGAKSKGDEVRDQLRTVADDVEGGTLARCGHFMPDEQPDELVARLLDFFGRQPSR